ncbi:MAG: single-stranded DNA-binding protein [Planctomycetaceae bacterium]|jgi:single-strand DNA-binding protein|nr:single-stranded DNA-binding protein [Planctomycetaceae bacterium]
MASYNRVVLVGNMTRDPEIRHIPSGLAVADIGLAVNDRRKTQTGEWIDEATFVDITLWGRQAEIAQEYTKKGSSILVEGRLKLDTWESEGQKRSKLKVVGERIVLLGTGGGSGRSAEGGGTAGYSQQSSYSRPAQSNRAPQPPQDEYDYPSESGDVPF